jgi:TolB-like protein
MPERLEALQNALRDRYAVERLLGEGGMASVYLARDERHHRPVAIKLLHPELTRAIGVERFGREIEIAARLSHPHILPLLDSGIVDLGPECPRCPYYVMPYVEGESLRDKLTRVRVLPLEEALRITREAADALEHAHRRGVVHRDIKPENILLSGDHAVVADFGIGRALDQAGAKTLTETGQGLGTPQYMSPEQIIGEREIDGRTDVYSLGCVLYEMLTSMPPGASGGSIQSLLARRLAEGPPRVRTANPAVPPAVERALLRALAVERDQRFRTAGEFAAAITSAPSGTFPAVEPRGLRRVGLIASVAVLVVALGLALARLARLGLADAITSIAIAPEMPDSATAYLSEGVLEAVADLLRQLPQLRVTAPSLVSQVQRQQPGLNADELGQRLRVGAVLTWSLRRGGGADSLVLNAELLRIPGGALVWSGRYRRPVSEVLSLQSEVARTISDSLRLKLTGEERAVLSRRPTTNSSAYELYLRGRHFYTRATPFGVQGAQAMVDSVLYYGEQALAIDSSFGQAWGLIANYHYIGAVRGWRTPFGAEVDSGIALSKRALALDSTSGEAWGNVAYPNLYLYDDWATAKRLLERALALSPTHPHTWNYYAIYLGEVEGRLDSAIGVARHAAELDAAPLTLNTLGDLYMRARLYDSAIAVLRRTVSLDSSVPGPQLRLVTSYERLGRYAEAVAARRPWQGERAAEPFARGLAETGPPGYRRALEANLRARIDSLLPQVGGPRQYPRDTLPPIPETRIALLYGQLGDWKSATDWVLKEYTHRPKRLRLWLTHPDMQGLRTDSRFLALVKREGLEELLSGRR